MTQQWHPPDQGPDEHLEAPERSPEHPSEPWDQRLPPILPPPTPALGIISLLMGLIGAAAAFVPILRVPGIMVGLIAATLGVVTVLTKGLGGKMIAACGLTAGLAAVPIAITMYLLPADPPGADQQGQALPADPSTSAPPSPSPAASPPGEAVTVVYEVIGENGPTTATLSYGFHGERDSETRRNGKDHEPLPFREEITVEGPLTRGESVSLVAATKAVQGGTLICRITVDGKVMAEGRSTPGPLMGCEASHLVWDVTP